MIWNRIVLSDGSLIVIENMPASDTTDYAGLENDIDHQTCRLNTGVTLSTLLGGVAVLTFRDGESNFLRVFRESTQRDTNPPANDHRARP